MDEGLLRTEQKQSGSGITRRTLGGLFWTFLGTGAQAGLQLLVLVVLARLLSPADFGVVTAALVVVGFSTIFSQLGIGPAVVQRPDLTVAHLRTGFTISLLLGASLAGLIWACTPVIVAFFRVDGLTPVLRALALIFPLQGISVVAESLMQRELRFRWLSAIEVITVAFGYGAVGIALALLGFGVWALVGAHLAQTVLKTVLLLLFQPHPMLPLLEWRAVGELMYFGGGFTAARVGNYLAAYGDNLVIGRCLGAEALGIYGRAYQLVAGPAMLFGGVLDRVLFPAMAKVQDCPERLAAAYRRGVALIALILLPASAVLLALAPELIHVVLGPGWSDVVIPLQLLSASLLFRTSYRMSDSLVRATGAVYRRAWRQAVFAALVVGGSLVGQFWGLAGVSIGVVVAITVNFFLMAQLSLDLATLTWRDFFKAHVPGLALGMLIGLEVWLVAEVFRAWSFSPLVVLIASIVAVLPSFLLPRYLPQLFLGQDGRWMLRTLAENLPSPGRAVFLWRKGDQIGGPSYQRS